MCNLPCSKNCIISEISGRTAVTGDNSVEAILTTGTTFQIKNAKLYVSVVTFYINDNIKLLEQLKQGFRRTISRNKYRFEILTQDNINALDYMVDPTFRNINRLFFFPTVCYYHVTYTFQSESTLYSCVNVKELLA